MRVLALFLLLFSIVFAKDVMLLNEFRGDENLSGWVMSEKYDGVRAIWDGKSLKSRNGNEIYAPAKWKENFPPFKIDGELFTKRGEFERVFSIVADKKPSDEWSGVKFMIFDVPDENGNLTQRLAVLKKFLDKNPNKNIVIIEQIPVKNTEHLNQFLDEILKNGGEGAVVRDPKAEYKSGRSDKILKVKKFHDSECKVLKIIAGKGKFKDKMGSVLCLDEKSGVEFRLGSGFSDKMRANPPKIGSIITYKYQNLTKNNKPRFPVFMRFKDEI
ncbi:DNA ligase [Campylobacter geochelonis]|uniref:DNA ligase n=1 Tax=Campylobacter geochelonis TaxID=1780362 RepID=UPI0007708B52|nr:DNA ligase [Campylobacter geochelonis]CZE47036.1 DNA ligase [Campylobacter geochelonis]CZE50968.1 DNA ligase [Campylobacter geochelonis]